MCNWSFEYIYPKLQGKWPIWNLKEATSKFWNQNLISINLIIVQEYDLISIINLEHKKGNLEQEIPCHIQMIYLSRARMMQY